MGMPVYVYRSSRRECDQPALALAMRIEIESYRADAEGQVRKDAEGLRFVEVAVHATATVKYPNVAATICDLAQVAEKHCLVSRSVSCPVHYHLSVEISEE